MQLFGGKKKFTVLLADDDPAEHAKFMRSLQEYSPSIKVESAYNGMQLLDHLLRYSNKAADQVPDLIITDLYMPFAGGIQVLKQIKMHPNFKNIPICVFSKNHDKTIQAKVLENGAAEFHKKPDDYAELNELMVKILDKLAPKAVVG